MEQHSGRRRRPALSCMQCRRRKIKCDRTNPCSHCLSAQSPCVYKVYNIEPRSRHHSGGSDAPDLASHRIAATPLPSIAAPSTSITGVSTEHNGRLSGSRPVTATATEFNDTRPSSRATGSELDLQDLLRRVKGLEQASDSNTFRAPSNTGQDAFTRQAGMYDVQSSLEKTRILRWSHWADSAPEFSNIYACFTEISRSGGTSSSQCNEVGTTEVQIGDLLHKCKDAARTFKASRPSRSLSRLDFDLDPPSRVVADTMVDLYFRSFESAYRILHIPSFRIEYERYWEHSDSTPSDVRLRVLLVIAIGSSLSEYGDTDIKFRSSVHQWVYAAQTWLSGPLEKNRLELGGIQVHCLTILARQIFSIGGDLIWMSMGTLMHSAMQIGIHRSAKNLPAMSVLQVELRKRLWATILEMALQSSLDSAMPPRISLDEYDNEPPLNIDDDEIDQSTVELRVAPRDIFTATSMQLLLLDSLSVRLRILQLLNGMHSEISYTNVLALSSDIVNACRRCSQFLNTHAASAATFFHKNLLDYHVRRFLIPLHCPFACNARDDPLFFYSLKVSLDTALTIVSPEQDEDFSRLMIIGGGSYREGFRAASTVISIELLAQVQGQSLDGTLQQQSAYRNFLKQAMDHMIGLSAKRIQKGETNVKSHLFLSMVMAEVEATETGVSVQFKVAQRAKDSLRYCYGLLQARATTDALPNFDSGLLTDSVDYQEDYEYDFESFLLNEHFP